MNRISRGGFHIRTNRTRLFHGAVLTAMTVTSLIFAGCSDDDEEETSSTAICGGEEYITATHFCFADVVYEKCGGNTWNPTNQFCDRRTPEQAYRFVTIGSQVWMAENLNYRNSAWAQNDVEIVIESGDKGSWCYGNNSTNCVAKGRLYTWNAATEACPNGWSLPAYEDFVELIGTAGTTVNSSAVLADGPLVADALKATSGWPSGQVGSNNLGFSALPGGERAGQYANSYYRGDSDLYMWSSTDLNTTNPNQARIFRVGSVNGNSNAQFNLTAYHQGQSVRCIRD